MKLFTFIFATSLLIGCTSETSTESPKLITEHFKVEKEKEPVIPNKILTMEVDGMSCVMGCGSSIRKELYTTNGVSEVEFDFEDGRKTQKAFIKFNSNKVSIEEMVQIVNTMNDNQFTVGNTSEKIIISEEKLDEIKEEEPNKQSSIIEETSKYKVSLPKFKIPNFIEVITSFLNPKTFNLSIK